MPLRLHIRNKLFLLDILEILIGSNLQLVAGRLIGHDDAMLMHLQGRDGPLLTNGTLHSSLHGACLVVTVHQNHHFTSIHHGAHANGQCTLGYLVHIVVEETGVSNDGVGGQRFLARTASEEEGSLKAM